MQGGHHDFDGFQWNMVDSAHEEYYAQKCRKTQVNQRQSQRSLIANPDHDRVRRVLGGKLLHISSPIFRRDVIVALPT